MYYGMIRVKKQLSGKRPSENRKTHTQFWIDKPCVLARIRTAN